MRRRGFTLVELVVALGISATLLVGMASAVMVASRSLPERGGPVVAGASLERTLEALATELSTARSIGTIGGRGITFTVGDRDGDSVPETVSWVWSGEAGEPLLRELNSEGGREASNGLLAATFEATIRDYTDEKWSTGLPAARDTLSAGEYERSGGLTSWYTVGGEGRLLQEVTPSFETTTDKWELTGVSIFASQPSSGVGPGMYIEAVALGDGGTPTGPVLGRLYVASADLPPSGDWVTAPVSGMVRVSVDQRIGVVVRSGDPTVTDEAGRVQSSVLTLAGDAMRGRTSDAGSWTVFGLNQLRFVCQGITWSGSEDQSVVTQRAGSVKVTLTDEAGYSATRTVGLVWPTGVGG